MSTLDDTTGRERRRRGGIIKLPNKVSAIFWYLILSSLSTAALPGGRSGQDGMGFHAHAGPRCVVALLVAVDQGGYSLSSARRNISSLVKRFFLSVYSFAKDGGVVSLRVRRVRGATRCELMRCDVT